MDEERQATQTERQQAQKLLAEGWLPYPFTVGALYRKEINRPSASVTPALWQAMREVLEDARRAHPHGAGSKNAPDPKSGE